MTEAQQRSSMTHNLRNAGTAAVILLLFLFAKPCTSQAQSAIPDYQVKAIFLYNFAQFVEWPSTQFDAPDSPFVIGILGKDPFGKYLDETVQGEKVNGHPMVVQRISPAEIGSKKMHIVFINVSDHEQLTSTLESLKSQSVLTVGDAPEFARLGGMIRFSTENNKTKIQINLEVAKEASLSISSKLLRLAEIVGDPK